MEEFILKAIKKDLPLKNPLDSPAKSEDGNLRIYFGGMKDAIEGYGKNIIDFLTS
ncbi:MAG: hypothetical protein GX638_00300 [Crenarchaeota archaeon]|nr:hypothetical protein [Thermoproteota archaeon]